MADENASLETLTDADRQLRKIAEGLANDPKTRAQYLRLIKQKFPNEVIPEIDLQDQIAAFAKPHIDELAKMKQERLAEQVNRQIEDARRALKDQGFSADDIKAIEKKMTEEKIPSHDTAAKYYKMERTMAAPTPAPGSLVNKMPIPGKELKEAGGAKKWARLEAEKAIADLKAGRVKLAS